MKTYEDMTLEELEENEDEFNEEDERAIEMYRLEHCRYFTDTICQCWYKYWLINDKPRKELICRTHTSLITFRPKNGSSLVVLESSRKVDRLIQCGLICSCAKALFI